MTRDELEHIIRASGEVTDQYEFMIVGSQSILGPVPNPHEVFTMSAEAHIYPCMPPNLRRRSKAHSAKARNSTRPSATTLKVSGLKPPSCRQAG